jgi:hypothetical protein
LHCIHFDLVLIIIKAIISICSMVSKQNLRKLAHCMYVSLIFSPIFHLRFDTPENKRANWPVV